MYRLPPVEKLFPVGSTVKYDLERPDGSYYRGTIVSHSVGSVKIRLDDASLEAINKADPDRLDTIHVSRFRLKIVESDEKELEHEDIDNNKSARTTATRPSKRIAPKASARKR